jgi:undecaprenyl-diphosphatase
MMRTLTHLGGARATVLPALALVPFDRTRLVGSTMLLANDSSHLAVQVLKRLVARPRPCDANGFPLAVISLPDPFSFPSGHAAAAVSVAASASLHVPELAPVLLPLALLVAA